MPAGVAGTEPPSLCLSLFVHSISTGQIVFPSRETRVMSVGIAHQHRVSIRLQRSLLRADVGGFKGGKGSCPLPKKLGPNKFQEKPSGDSRMLENLSAAGAPSQAPLGSLQHSPIPPCWWGGGWLPLHKNPTPVLGSLGFGSFWPRP